MAGVKVTVTRNSFPALARALPQRIGRINELSAKEIETEAKQNAPVDTGRLRDEIEAVKLAAFTWAVISPTPYAHFVHDGTSVMPPRPYLLRAARTVQGRWLDRIDAALKQATP